MRKVTFVGPGRLGGALAIALAQKGYEIEYLVLRDGKKGSRIVKKIRPEPKIITLEDLGEIFSDIVFITTQDFEIERVAALLAQNLTSKPAVFHTSGALSSEILNDLKRIGCQTGSMHPLVSVSDPVPGSESFKGAFFCVEGESEAVTIAKKIVADLGGRSFAVETAFKVLYHASAVTASGHLVALIDAAVEMLAKCGLPESTAQETLWPLIQSTVQNLGQQTTSAALTGPIARADLQTFEKHLDSLEKNVSPDAQEIYLTLAERSVHLAERQGAGKENLEKILKQISLAKKKIKC